MSTSHRPRLVLTGSQSKWEMSIEHPRELNAILGDDILAVMYKCFVGVDRIATLEHLIHISQIDYAPRHGGRDTPSAERNMHLLFLLLSGTLYELGGALQQLCSAKCFQKIANKSKWEPLNELRKQWNNESFASRIRNGFSHHLGEIGDFKRGIDCSPETVELAKGEGSRFHMSRFVEPWDALLRAENISTDAFDQFIQKAQKSHSALPELVTELFRELLLSNGVDTADERTL